MKINAKGIHLDTTVLQSLTAIDLVGYIMDQQEVILKVKNGDNIEKKEFNDLAITYERIITKHTAALHRRIGRTKYEKNFVDEDEEDDKLYNPST